MTYSGLLCMCVCIIGYKAVLHKWVIKTTNLLYIILQWFYRNPMEPEFQNFNSDNHQAMLTKMCMQLHAQYVKLVHTTAAHMCAGTYVCMGCSYMYLMAEQLIHTVHTCMRSQYMCGKLLICVQEGLYTYGMAHTGMGWSKQIWAKLNMWYRMMILYNLYDIHQGKLLVSNELLHYEDTWIHQHNKIEKLLSGFVQNYRYNKIIRINLYTYLLVYMKPKIFHYQIP